MNVAGVTPNGYNGTFTITSASANQITYNKTAALACGRRRIGHEPDDPNAGPCIEYCGYPWGSWGYQPVTPYTDGVLAHLSEDAAERPERPSRPGVRQLLRRARRRRRGHERLPARERRQRDHGRRQRRQLDRDEHLRRPNGANCVALAVSSLTTEATSAAVGAPIHDTAHLTPRQAQAGRSRSRPSSGPAPTRTAPAQRRSPRLPCPSTARATTRAETSHRPPPGPTTGRRDYSGAGLVLGSSSPCGAANETSIVVDGKVSITPPTATNAVNSNHTLTITVAGVNGAIDAGTYTRDRVDHRRRLVRRRRRQLRLHRRRADLQRRDHVADDRYERSSTSRRRSRSPDTRSPARPAPPSTRTRAAAATRARRGSTAGSRSRRRPRPTRSTRTTC